MTIRKENAPEGERTALKGLSAMTLRNRIAFYYTVTTAVLIAIVFTVINFMVDSIVYRQFDEAINHEVAEILKDTQVSVHDFKSFESFRNFIDDNKDEESDEKTGEKKQPEVDLEFIQLVNAEGRVINKSVNLSRNELAYDAAHGGNEYFNSSFGGITVRQLQIPLNNRNGRTEGYLIVAVPLQNAIIVLRGLQNVFLLSFPAIILTLFILTRLIAGRSIRPIEEVIATAEKMTQLSLDQRIALPFHRDELYRLSVTFNSLLDRLQDAFQREKQFTADASHELKTPLATLKGTLEVLIRKPRDREHYENRIGFCLTEVNRMSRLIEQLLMLARCESSRIMPHIESVSLIRHLEAVVARMQPAAVEKEISISFERTETDRIKADPAMLEMIFENILSNAVKYSPANSSIAIGLKQGAGSVICTITDHGIGISQEQMQGVFERFYRVDASRSSSTGGFGLGLSIVKKLADLQKITLSVMSEPNSGTAFTLTLPSAGGVAQ